MSVTRFPERLRSRLITFVTPSPQHEYATGAVSSCPAVGRFVRSALGRTCAHVFVVVFGVLLFASRAAADVQFAQGDPNAPLTISADRAERIPDGLSDVWVLSGNCLIQQGDVVARSQSGVIWVEKLVGSPGYGVSAYLESNVLVERSRRPLAAGPQPGMERLPSPTLSDQKWMGKFTTHQVPRIAIRSVVVNPAHDSDLMRRAVRSRPRPPTDGIFRTQFTEEIPTGPPVAAAGTRRLRAFPRSDVRVQAEWLPSQNGQESIAVVKNGVQIIVEGVPEVGVVDISTDRLVIWTRGLEGADLSGQTTQSSETPLEFYMEGNIEFRQGERIIYASAMYYDVRANVGVVLDAEMLTPMEQYAGKLRVAARELRQLSKDQFRATGARMTSSRLGEPTYWLEADSVDFQDRQTPIIDPLTGQPVIDPLTNQPAIDHERLITGAGNRIYLGGVPIFYWPRITTDLNDGVLYLRRIRVRSDGIFGTQLLTDWNAYELFGLKPIEGTEWLLSGDYMSERGPGGGTSFRYDRPGFLGLAGPTRGFADVWGIHDTGLDNLGLDRRALDPGKEFRGRAFWQHRQHFWNGFQVTGEVGFISDRNFLEQYFEDEWDTQKDQTTGIELKRITENRSWSITSDVRLNDIYTQTEWLPRGDHFWLGESLLFDRLTWYEHSSAGYARFKTATPPTDPADAVNYMPMAWEVPNDGERLVTTHELDLPMQLGHVRMVPYVLGQLAHWGSDINGDDIQRAYGQFGVRASLPMWRVDPCIESRLLNVHGLAHKVVFDAEFAHGEANRSVEEFPLYDPLDDDSIEAFRRRYTEQDFGPGATIPMIYDERYYAVRSGLGSWVTSPATEVLDDLTVLRLGARQRWQTKRGMPGARRIIDYVVFDTHLSLFPKKDRDNFGEYLGLLDYDFRWHVGDRFTLLSDGIFDVFAGGQRVVTFGGLVNRPYRGSLYLGYRTFDGPFTNQVLLASLNYRMSEKWIASFGSSVDLSNDGNIGQHLAITRLGESFLVRVGFNIDESKDNVGVKLAIEPRFLRSGQGKPIQGIFVPPAGANGLE